MGSRRTSPNQMSAIQHQGSVILEEEASELQLCKAAVMGRRALSPRMRLNTSSIQSHLEVGKDFDAPHLNSSAKLRALKLGIHSTDRTQGLCRKTLSMFGTIRQMQPNHMTGR